jgi:tryptophanyl-tRNA synthetase
MADEYKEFKVGDLITSYRKGYWKLVKIDRRFYTQKDVDTYHCYKDKKVGEEYSPLFHYQAVLTPQGKKVMKANSQIHQCDAVYCKKIGPFFFQDQIKEMRAEVEKFKQKMTTLALIYQEMSGDQTELPDFEKLDLKI